MRLYRSRLQPCPIDSIDIQRQCLMIEQGYFTAGPDSHSVSNRGEMLLQMQHHSGVFCADAGVDMHADDRLGKMGISGMLAVPLARELSARCSQSRRGVAQSNNSWLFFPVGHKNQEESGTSWRLWKICDARRDWDVNRRACLPGLYRHSA